MLTDPLRTLDRCGIVALRERIRAIEKKTSRAEEVAQEFMTDIFIVHDRWHCPKVILTAKHFALRGKPGQALQLATGACNKQLR